MLFLPHSRRGAARKVSLSRTTSKPALGLFGAEGTRRISISVWQKKKMKTLTRRREKICILCCFFFLSGVFFLSVAKIDFVRSLHFFNNNILLCFFSPFCLFGVTERRGDGWAEGEKRRMEKGKKNGKNKRK